MTTTTTARPRLTTDPVRLARFRKRICLATILACLPYILLKIAWVSGWGIGANSSDFAGTTIAANTATGLLDMVAIAIAILLVHPVGRRIPAFLIAFPLWIAAGLLAPVAGGFVLGSAVQLLSGGGSPLVDDVLQPWVFAVVYGGFVLQAVLLGTGLVFYARERWQMLLSGGRAHDGAGHTRPLQNLLGWIFIPAGLGYAILNWGWAVTGGGRFPDPSTGQRVMLTLLGAFAIGACLALAELSRGDRLRRRWLALGFVGTAVVFTDALTGLVNALLIAPDDWGHAGFTPDEALALLFIALSALGGAIGGALRFVEECRTAPEARADTKRERADTPTPVA
ncbi:hypothetical protein [Pseudactinotalea sp. Z1732]|uniref:hypothetical protein n=1 Tax=Pseudactinotalea sp. Z1732 TaxID=3413026 RepID=UPI003C7DEF91